MCTIHAHATAVGAALDAIADGAAAFARRAQKMFIVLAVALGAILLALSATLAYAAPGDGQQGPNAPNVPSDHTAIALPPPLHASENPVLFGLFETTGWIKVTAPPYNKTVRVIAKEDGVQTGPGAIIGAGTPIDLIAEIHYGKIHTSQLETIPENGEPKLVGPVLTITTKRREIAMPMPQPPAMNPTLIPNRPDLN